MRWLGLWFRRSLLLRSSGGFSLGARLGLVLGLRLRLRLRSWFRLLLSLTRPFCGVRGSAFITRELSPRELLSTDDTVDNRMWVRFIAVGAIGHAWRHDFVGRVCNIRKYPIHSTGPCRLPTSGGLIPHTNKRVTTSTLNNSLVALVCIRDCSTAPNFRTWFSNSYHMEDPYLRI